MTNPKCSHPETFTSDVMVKECSQCHEVIDHPWMAEIERLQAWNRQLLALLHDFFHARTDEAKQDAISTLKTLSESLVAHEPCELRPPVKLEDYGPVIDEVAPVTKEAWDAMKPQGASRDASPADIGGARCPVVCDGGRDGRLQCIREPNHPGYCNFTQRTFE